MTIKLGYQILKMQKAYYLDFRIQSIKQAHYRTDTVLAQYYMRLDNQSILEK